MPRYYILKDFEIKTRLDIGDNYRYLLLSKSYLLSIVIVVFRDKHKGIANSAISLYSMAVIWGRS